ncbi:hypothetical protein BpHYR1_004829 [Brachionus plicatilis]|uniref:Uncharacterized protein n=1 Tax=Brachionus plicatilis TaxID=10195 RepID=A0A3M7QME5_BRAPC|nr:hypothetical protein BpHYR1_004829 [Brachionus plicatilis]
MSGVKTLLALKEPLLMVIVNPAAENFCSQGALDGDNFSATILTSCRTSQVIFGSRLRMTLNRSRFIQKPVKSWFCGAEPPVLKQKHEFVYTRED